MGWLNRYQFNYIFTIFFHNANSDKELDIVGMSADENVNKNLLVIQPRWGSMPIEKDVFESTISFEESEEYMDEIHSFLLERETHAFEVEEISKELDIPPDEAESCLVRLLRGNLVRYKKPYWIVVQKKTHS